MMRRTLPIHGHIHIFDRTVYTKYLPEMLLLDILRELLNNDLQQSV